ncbi:MAG: hypothetical protein EZS28_029451 [Streblomastix strix]|uniref:Uncharacterized protein n=1 Tax=Streblomastix strix TaxID=222440 RepID=A0A5J4UYQ9_9EUKA|nr:MAG: hypothetical protein EZS28_029451 [Streblomastix strix]
MQPQVNICSLSSTIANPYPLCLTMAIKSPFGEQMAGPSTVSEALGQPSDILLGPVHLDIPFALRMKN